MNHTSKFLSGPNVGVLISVNRSLKSGAPIGREAKIIREKFAMARKYGINLFIFYPDGVCWSKRAITGYVLAADVGQKGNWTKRVFNFPEIVYNRIRNRRIEKQINVINLLKKLNSDPHIILLNRRFFDKWEVYRALLDDPATTALVPPTVLLSPRSLKHYLHTGSSVYIKPRNNNAARGIIKIRRTSPWIYEYCQAQSSPPVWESCISFGSLWKQMSFFIKNPHSYVVQKGIDLCRVDGRILDFRVQVQKDDRGEWVFTGAEARLAQKGRISTTGSVYGTRMPFNKTLDQISRGSEDFKNRVDLQLAALYRQVPAVLEKKLGMPLAVLSLDIGLDIHGKIWIIEASSKPEPFAARRSRVRHFQYLMEYFIYLS